MGLRFRKSVTIAKGVRVNLSKSGASLSLGGRGHSVNIGKSGVRGSVGLPGTGLSYSKNFGNPLKALTNRGKNNEESSSRRSGRGSSRSSEPAVNAVAIPSQINVFMDENGKVVVEDHKGNEITDAAVLKRIKATDSYKEQVAQLEAQRQQEIDEIIENAHEENESYLNIYQLSCAVATQADFESRLPMVENEDDREFFGALINGDPGAISDVFDSWIASVELPCEMNVNYEWEQEQQVLMLDVDLPEIEDLPTTTMTKAANGSLKEKNKTQAELKEEYARLVFGLAVFVSSNAFGVSPAIRKVLLSAYTQRRNKVGDENDDYIYSFKFPREMFENIDLTQVEPQAFCMQAANRVNLTTAMQFKNIVPFDEY